MRVHVPGDDGRRTDVGGEVAQERVPTRVAALERPLQLDVEAVAEGSRELDCRVGVADAEPGARAAGEADEPLAAFGQKLEIECGRQDLGSLLRPRPCVCRSQQPAEIRVSRRRLDEQRHVGSADERNLGTGERPHPHELRRVGELERAVDPVVVGERERLVAELGRPQDQLLGMRGAVQERIG